MGATGTWWPHIGQGPSSRNSSSSPVSGISRIGLLYATLFTRFGTPTLAATLAGLLAFLDLQLQLFGTEGSINLPYGSALVPFGQQQFLPSSWDTSSPSSPPPSSS